MPVFVRQAGAWVECAPFQRAAGAFTGNDHQLFARDADQWKLIWPDPATVGSIRPVENLAAANITHHFAEISWTNPAQPELEPTEIEIRIAEHGAVWTRADVDATGFTWNSLEPATDYVAQVRYQRRVNGVKVAHSPTRNVSFTTAPAPVGAPAPDPGSPGGTGTVFPIDSGGWPDWTPVAEPNGAWWEWIFQILELDTTQITYTDTAIMGETSGLDDAIAVDASSLDNTRTYRLCKRRVEDTTGDGVADVFEEWECGAPFAGGFDWGVTCGGIPLSPIVAGSVAADAAWAFPRYCAVGDGLDTTGLVDAVSNTQIGKGADMAAVYANEAGEWGAVAGLDGGITLTAGLAAVAATVVPGADFTVMARRRFSPGHVLSNGRTTTIASIGGGAIVLQIVETATGWYARAQFATESGFRTLTTNARSLDDRVHNIALVWEFQGAKRIYLDGAGGETFTGDDFADDFAAAPMYWTAETPIGTTFQQIGWARALSQTELWTMSPITADFLEEFDDEDTTPWQITQTSTTYAPIVEGDTSLFGGKQGIILRGNGSSGQGLQRATMTYPAPIDGGDYTIEWVGHLKRGNFGSTNGNAAAYVWFRGSAFTNCLRIGTFDNLDVMGAGNISGLAFQRVVNATVVQSVVVHTDAHHGSGTSIERFRVVCAGGSCQFQDWNGSEWVDNGAPITDDGSLGAKFGMVAAGQYSFGGQYGEVALDYIAIERP